ncbi:hypothetical protein R1flu_019158 [Riccia fluitans]|uniref:Uncharacterized protein n=1 Tax=Riccia fluitans TaxID=41844 RepID=A0ABD1ZHW5_9MARC
MNAILAPRDSLCGQAVWPVPGRACITGENVHWMQETGRVVQPTSALSRGHSSKASASLRRALTRMGTRRDEDRNSSSHGGHQAFKFHSLTQSRLTICGEQGKDAERSGAQQGTRWERAAAQVSASRAPANQLRQLQVRALVSSSGAEVSVQRGILSRRKAIEGAAAGSDRHSSPSRDS